MHSSSVAIHVILCLTSSFFLSQIIFFTAIEFFLLLYAGFIMINLIQSLIRTLICSVFLHRFLVVMGHAKYAKLIFIIYIMVFILFDLFIFIDIFVSGPLNKGIKCDGNTVWQIFLLISMDSLQSCVMIITSIIMHKKYNKEQQNKSVLSNSGRSNDPSNRFYYQMKLLAGFYVICICMDWIIFTTGRLSLETNNLLCFRQNLILVNSEKGALFMLTETISIYFYAIFMWYVFYAVPKKYGVVSRRAVDDVGMIGVERNSIMIDEENVKMVVRELEYDRHFIKKQ